MENFKKNTVYVIHTIYDLSHGPGAGFNISIMNVDKDLDVSDRSMIDAYKSLVETYSVEKDRRISEKECTDEDLNFEITPALSLHRIKLSSNYKYVNLMTTEQADYIENESDDVNELYKHTTDEDIDCDQTYVKYIINMESAEVEGILDDPLRSDC